MVGKWLASGVCDDAQSLSAKTADKWIIQCFVGSMCASMIVTPTSKPEHQSQSVHAYRTDSMRIVC